MFLYCRTIGRIEHFNLRYIVVVSRPVGKTFCLSKFFRKNKIELLGVFIFAADLQHFNLGELFGEYEMFLI
jgi:hypothetical protein